MRKLFPIFLSVFFALNLHAATPDLPDDVIDTGPCNLTCWCTGDECFWMSVDLMCSGGAFCEAQQEEHECSVKTKQAKIPGRCWELKPQPPKPPIPPIPPIPPRL